MAKKRINPMKCSECDFVAKSKSGLTNHLKRTHKKSQILKRDKRGRIVKGGSKGGSNKTGKNGTAGTKKKSALDDPVVQADFLTAAALGANNEACCAYAKVSSSAYYSYVTDHPEFAEKLDQKRHQPYLLAVETVVQAMKSDPKLALKYLERKHKDEFSIRREMTGADGAKLFEGMSDEELRRFIQSGND